MRASSRRSHHSSSAASGREAAAQREAFGLQRGQRGGDVAGREAERRGERGLVDRAEPFEPAAQDFDQRLLGRPARARHAAPARRSADRAAPRATARRNCGSRSAATHNRSSHSRRTPGSTSPALSGCEWVPACAGMTGVSSASRASRRQLGEPSPPARAGGGFGRGQEAEPGQAVVHFVAVGRLGPGLLAHPRDRLGVEPAEVGGVLRRQPAAAHHRLRAALLERRVVEIGVGPRRQHFERQRRRLGQVARDDPDLAGLDARRAAAPARRCPSPRSRQSAIVWRTSGWSGISRSPTRFSAQASWSGKIAAIRSSASMRGSGGGTFLPPRKRGSASATPATQRQRVMNIGASSSAWTSTSRTRRRVQVARHLGELEAVRRGQRQHDVVLGRRRLQLEIELAAEALAQRQAPGAVEPAAEGRMDDQLHAADFVEEALEDDACPASAARRARHGRRRGTRRSAAPRPRRCRASSASQPQRRLHPARAAGIASPDLRPAAGEGAGIQVTQARVDLRAQPRHRLRQLVAAARRLAEPERDVRRLALRVLDPHRAALDAQDAVGGVAELEHVAGQALDREILVDACRSTWFSGSSTTW